MITSRRLRLYESVRLFGHTVRSDPVEMAFQTIGAVELQDGTESKTA